MPGVAPQHRQMFDRLMGRTILAETNRVMGHDIDDLLTHQRRETHRTARIVGKGQERAAIGNEAAMQGKAVHGGRHAMFADAVMNIAAGKIFAAKRPACPA